MNMEMFLQSLGYMGQGLLGIFIVMLLIAGGVALLNKLFSK